MKKKKQLFLVIILFFALITTCTGNFNDSKIQPDVSGDIVNKKEALDARKVLEDNLHYSTTKDIEGYLSTIDPRSHEETREVIEPFFEENDIQHALLEFKVLTQENEKILVKTKQKIINEKTDKNKEDIVYRNHIAEVLIEFIKENEEWKIASSSISDIEFIE